MIDFIRLANDVVPTHRYTLRKTRKVKYLAACKVNTIAIVAANIIQRFYQES